jgi:hypothetical protein
VWSYPPSSPGSSKDSEEKEEKDSLENTRKEGEEVVGYDGLSEFLTRRTGEPAGESERLRKRDRIMEWIRSSKSTTTTTTTTNSGGNALIQPIRVQDGQVDVELANVGTPIRRTITAFDQLFARMLTGSLSEILSKSERGTDD